MTTTNTNSRFNVYSLLNKYGISKNSSSLEDYLSTGHNVIKSKTEIETIETNTNNDEF